MGSTIFAVSGAKRPSPKLDTMATTMTMPMSTTSRFRFLRSTPVPSLSARTALCPEFLRPFGPQAEFPLNGVGDPAAGKAVAVGIDGVGHGGVGRRSGE